MIVRVVVLTWAQPAINDIAVILLSEETLMPKEVLYRVKATATGGGREGHAQTDDGKFETNLVKPKELGGSGQGGVNPEQLFATGYSACFLGAMQFYAAQKEIEIPEDVRVSVSVGLGPREDTGFGLEVAIEVSLPGLDKDVAEDLVKGAHEVCPYSHATKGTLDITPKLV